MSVRDSVRRWALPGIAVSLLAAAPASAADTVAPVTGTATFAAAANGNSNWRLTAPQTLQLSATDDVAVAKLQYSMDGGATYVDVPVTAGPSVSANVTLSDEGNTTVRYRAIDSSGNTSRGATTNTTLNQASAAGATAVRLTSTTGRGAGDSLLIDTGAGQETATIATIVTPAPAAPAPNVTLTAPLANAHAANATVAGTALYSTVALQIDTKGPVATWGTQATTLNQGVTSGNTQVRLASLTGRAVGETLQLDQGGNAETVKIATIISPEPAAPAPNVTLTSALAKSHVAGSNVYVPSIVDGKILQSQTLTPLRTDPRLRDATDTVASGAGGAAPRRMTIDGTFMVPKTLQLNRLTTGKHTQTVSLQDVAGSTAKYTNTFVVTTSFADLAIVIDQLADNALRTTLNGATTVGATGLRLATPFGFREGQEIVVDTGDNQERVTIAKALKPPPTLNTTLSAAASAGATQVRLASYSTETNNGVNPPSNNGPIVGQPIVLDTGANQEVVTVKRHISPLPAAPAPNVELSAPLAKDHAAGTATTLANVILSSPLTKAHATGVTVADPQPYISAAKATELKALLADAKAKADASNTAGAIASLQQFVTAAGSEAPLSSAGTALIAQLNGTPVDTSGTGVTVGAAEPDTQAIRAFYNPVPFVATPGATYKILISGRAGGFRHQSIVDFEWMIQQLGATNGFDVEIWDPNINASPGRQAPAGVSLATSPFMDLATLKQYKTIVMNSTVGINASATFNATEFANLQAYIRGGGGIVAIHGGTDSMQNVPWFMDLIGAGFSNHGSNQGGILIDTESGGHVELVTADPAHTSTAAMPARWYTVEENYNTNRDPVDLGIAHPLVYENEDSLMGQIGYGTGSLHNTDRHGMVWCRNFDGGRSFTSTLGHNWQFATEAWFRGMILNAIQWTGGQEYANCVTFNEVKDLLSAAVADGNVKASTAMSAALNAADTAYRAGDNAAAATAAKQFVAEAKRISNCGCADGGAALLKIQSKGVELVNWMSGNEVAPPTPALQTDTPGSVGGSVPATLALTLGAPATFGAFTPGVAKEYTATTTATVVSTAGDATLSVADPSTNAPGRLVNGTFALPQPLQGLGVVKTWTAPTSNEAVPVTFKQAIAAGDALRTGTYSKNVTFTLSTTSP
ncbi:ThuA domain-containing protein [Solirubrobacter soli]|uniref:ThuA domain-containing protein n=1 Tax=Solirubrobacter soli TaxID=363832 RepID=UPI0003F5A090|nr:ThuA domain-containing protein [Solirubrobacter soli]